MIPNILLFTSTMIFDLTQKKMSCASHCEIRAKGVWATARQVSATTEALMFS
jgi:hypothetical protein